MEIFGIGFPEIMLIMVVGLIVFGPERLPEIAREAGRMVRQFRQMTSEATSEIRTLTSDLNVSEDLKKTFEEIKSASSVVTQEMSGLREQVTTTVTEVTEQYAVKYEPANVTETGETAENAETAQPQIEIVPSDIIQTTATVTSTVREISQEERDEFNRRRMEELALSQENETENKSQNLIESAVQSHPLTALPPLIEPASANPDIRTDWHSSEETPNYGMSMEDIMRRHTETLQVNPPTIFNPVAAMQMLNGGNSLTATYTATAAVDEEPANRSKPRIARRSAFGGARHKERE